MIAACAPLAASAAEATGTIASPRAPAASRSLGMWSAHATIPATGSA
jgi:hypothetical protein